MKAKLDIWRARSLSLLGKCLIVKCLGISHLIYTASMLTIPNSYIPTIECYFQLYLEQQTRQNKKGCNVSRLFQRWLTRSEHRNPV